MLAILDCLTMCLSRLTSSIAERILVADSFSTTEVDYDMMNIRERKLGGIHTSGHPIPDTAPRRIHAKQGTNGEPEAW